MPCASVTMALRNLKHNLYTCTGTLLSSLRRQDNQNKAFQIDDDNANHVGQSLKMSESTSSLYFNRRIIPQCETEASVNKVRLMSQVSSDHWRGGRVEPPLNVFVFNVYLV